jgi:predicted nucleotidyltransferase
MTLPGHDPLFVAVGRAMETLPEVQAAFVFGSQATGRARADSDIDVAVLLDAVIAPVDKHSRLKRVFMALGAYVAADRLDVVVLNDAPPALAFQVLKRGKQVFVRNQVAVHRFLVATYSRHSDFEWTERFFREVTRRRASTGNAGGR